jgi:hypothetical protein
MYAFATPGQIKGVRQWRKEKNSPIDLHKIRNPPHSINFNAGLIAMNKRFGAL